MSVLKKLSKVKNASFDELNYRLRHAVWLKYERFLYTSNFGTRLLDLQNSNGDQQSNGSKSGAFFESLAAEKASNRRFISENYPNWLGKAIQKADQILNGSLEFLGITVEHSGKIDWHQDPVTRKKYDVKFYQDVRIFDGDYGLGDIKHVWEVNRHQYFIDLAKAYYLTGDKKYFSRIIFWAEDWIEKNAYNFGVNWTSALEIAVRAYAWIWTYFFIRDAEGFTPAHDRLFLTNLRNHGRYLESHFSWYFSPYNHLVGEISVLFMIGMLFPRLPEAKRWRENGWSYINETLHRQFYEDGFCVEQASFYHHFTLGFFLQAFLLAKRNGMEPSKSFEKMLEKAIEVSHLLSAPDGKIPRIGDCDDAQSIYLRHDISWDFTAFHQIGAILFGMQLFGDPRPLHEEVFWLLGERCYEKYCHLMYESKYPELIDLPFSGYFVHREKNEGTRSDYLLFDCGEVCDGLHEDNTPSAGHGHADLLAYEYHPFGIPWLVDPGFYTYNGDYSWHRHFRSADGHNTLSIDDESPLFHFKRLSWTRHPELGERVGAAEQGIAVVGGSYRGFRQLSSEIEHHRYLCKVAPQLILIFDWLGGSGLRRVRQNLHFHPSIDAEVRDAATVVSQFEDQYRMTARIFPQPEKIVAKKGESQPQGGWYAPSYNALEEAYHAAYEYRTRLPLGMLCMLHTTTQQNGAVLDLEEPEIGEQTCRVHFRLDGKNYRVNFNLSGAPLSLESGVRSDSRVIIEIEGESLQTIVLGGAEAELRDGTKMTIRPQTLRWI